MIKILIPEGIPSLNKGEAAILIGMLESFKTLGDFEVSLFSTDYDIDKKRYTQYGVKVIDARKTILKSRSPQKVGIIRFFLSFGSLIWNHIIFAILYKLFGLKAGKLMKGKVWQSYAESDIIILAHNGAFSVLYHPMLIYFFRFLKKPVVINGASFGKYIKYINLRPFIIKWIDILTRFCLNKANLIMLRESISYEYLKGIGVSNPSTYVTADPAFLLSPASPDIIKGIMLKENINKNGRPLIGMTVTRGMSSRAFKHLGNVKERYEKYVKVKAEVVDYIIEKFHAIVVFIPHCLGPEREFDDRMAAQDIYRLVKNKSMVRVITNEYGPEEIKGIIGQLDLLIGQRLHSVIDAVSMHIPAIAISFPTDYRTYGIIGDMDQKKWLYNIENFQFESLISQINNAWLVREEIKKELIYKMNTLRQLALENGKLIKKYIVEIGK